MSLSADNFLRNKNMGGIILQIRIEGVQPLTMTQNQVEKNFDFR